MKIEHLILANLLKREEYVRKVVAFIVPEYFSDAVERSVFDCIAKYFSSIIAVPPNRQ